MKTPLAILLLFLTLFGACKKGPEDIGPCGLKNPIEELPWLKEEIERVLKFSFPFENTAYFTVMYKGERVFWPNRTIDASDFTSYRMCDGKRKSIDFSKPMDEETKKFAELIQNTKLSCPYLLWSSPGFQSRGTCP